MAGRIVVGIDGSSQSSAALEWAIGRATAGGDSLSLVSAYTLPAMEFYGFVADPTSVDWAREYSMQILSAGAARAREADPAIDVAEAAEIGPAGAVLISAAEGAEMLVVGRRGLGTAMSALLGSVSDRLSVHRDDEMKHALQGLMRSGHPTRTAEWHDPEPAAEDDPEVWRGPVVPGRVPVVIEIADPAFEPYADQMPGGAFGQVAVYSKHFHHVAIMRKILLRMASWMNYLFPFH